MNTIGTDAFAGCTNVENLNYDSNVVDPTVFGKKLKTVVVGNNVTSIGDKAFRGCSDLTSVTIGNGVKTIGNQAFYYCTSLASANLGSGVESIGSSAFNNCTSLTSLTLPSTVTSIGVGAFSFCDHLFSINIPSGITDIPESAFFGCTSLASIEIPSSVKTIGMAAFCNCGLTSVTLPEGVTLIGRGAFEGCASLASVTIPESVTSIGEGAFIECNNLTDVTNYAVVPQTINENTFATYSGTLHACTLHVLKRLNDVYASADVWKNFTIVDDLSKVYNLADKAIYTGQGDDYYTDITYTRNFSNTNWQALYVPFSMNLEEWQNDFDVARVYNIIDYDYNEDGEFDKTYLVVKKVTTALKPNYPYLIRAKQAGDKTLTLNNRSLAPAETNSMDCSSADLTFTLTGSYQGIEGSVMCGNGFYAIGGGELNKATTSAATLPAQRWYMGIESRDGSSAAVKAQTIQILTDGEDTTEIERVTAISQAKSQTSFDLTGRAVKAGTKGVNIINGKKIIR